MVYRRIAALLGIATLVLAACTGGGTESEAAESQAAESQAAASEPAASAAGDCVVGVSWNNYQEERWALRDEPAIQAALEAGRRELHLGRRRLLGGAAGHATSRT